MWAILVKTSNVEDESGSEIKQRFAKDDGAVPLSTSELWATALPGISTGGLKGWAR